MQTLVDKCITIQAGLDTGIVHVHCCVDVTVMLCGLVYLDGETGADESNCVVCNDTEDNDPDYCPKRGVCIDA